MPATAKKIDLENAPRTAPVLDPGCAVLDSSGQVTRNWIIYMPKGAISADLNEPQIFSKLQASAKSLRKLDHVTFVDSDDAWCATALVGEASGSSVSLIMLKTGQLPQRSQQLYSDDTYRIEIDRGQFAVIRKRDGHNVGTWPTEALALLDLKNQYPKRA